MILFSNFLLIDTVVSAAARVLLIHLFRDTYVGEDLCTTQSRFPVTSVHMETRSRTCLFAMDGLQIALVVILIGMTTFQGMLALAVRKIGVAARLREVQADMLVDVTVAPVEKTPATV